jgi:hypothetical protein
MVEDKRADGQLDECDLTMRDLRVIQELFVRTLCGTLHARIEYPGSPANMPAAAPANTPALTLVAADPEEAILENLTLNESSGLDTSSISPGSGITPIALSRLPNLSETDSSHGDSNTESAFRQDDANEQSLLGTRARRRRKPSDGS